MRKNLTFYFIVIFSLSALNGCTSMWSGVKIDIKNIDQINLDITSRDDIVSLFGDPDTISYNKREEITTYQYKYVRNASLGLPIPVSCLQLGKASDRGYILNIFLKGDIVVNYELINLKTKWFFKE